MTVRSIFCIINHMVSCAACGGSSSFFCKAELYASCEKEIFRCENCGTAFYHPVPAPEEIAKCYPPQYFDDFLSKYWKDYYKGRRVGAEIKRFKPRGAFFDIGCALGTMLAGVRDESGWEVSGLEFSDKTAATGAELNGVKIFSGLLERSGIAPGSFDFIFMNNVLEHLPDPAGSAAFLRALLREPGRMRLVIPNGAADIMPTKILWDKHGRAFRTRHSGHLFFFTRKGLFALLRKAGFEIIGCKNFHFADGLKTRGWLPGTLKKLYKPAAIPVERAETRSVSELRALIPPKSSRLADDIKAFKRGLFKLPGLSFGADFDLLLK